MHDQRDAQVHRSLEHRAQVLAVERRTLDVRTDLGPTQPELEDAAPQLADGRARVLQRERREPGEAVRRLA